jgi:hypothetical protein
MYFNNFPKVDYDVYGFGATQNVTNITSHISISSKKLDDVAFYSYYVVPDSHRPDNVSYTLYGTAKYYWTFFIVNPHLRNSYIDWPQRQSDLLNFVINKYEGLGAIVDGDVWGKFAIGESVEGAISGATGTVMGVYPSTEWVNIKQNDGSVDFKSDGENIVGTTNQSVTAKTIKSAAYAPHHFVEQTDGTITDKRSAGVDPVSFYVWEQEQALEKSKIRVIKPEFIDKISKEFLKEIKSSLG